MERLETAVPPPIRQLSSRTIYAVLIGILVTFVVTAIVCGALLGVVHIKSNTPFSSSSGSTSETAKQTGNQPKWSNPGLCTDNAECMHTAAWMTQNMDSSVDPCDNFYKYACGGWVQNQTIPPDWRYFSVTDKLWFDMDKKIKTILKSRIKDRSAGSTERKLKEFYRSCLHDYGRMKEGGKKIIEIIRNRFGGWYVMNPDTWNSNQWDASGALTAAISEYMIDVLFRVDVYPYNGRGMITITNGGIGLYAPTFHDRDSAHVQAAYKDYMRDVGKLLLRDANVTVNNEALEQFVDDAYYQESHIAGHMLALQRAGTFYRSSVSTVRELTANFTQINWLGLFRAYFGPWVNSDTQVYVRSQSYFSMIDQLLRNESVNKNRILNNYLVWSFADTFGYYLSMEYKFAGFKLWKAMWGQIEGISTQESCIQFIEWRLGLALTSEFVNNHVDADTIAKSRQLFDQIKNTYENQIDNVFWMDNTTKFRVKDKLSKMDAMIGFPQRFFDKAFIDEIHIDLNVNRSQGFLKNIMSVNNYLKKTLQMELQSGPDYYKWHFLLHEGAYGLRPDYFWESNHILVPSGAMQFPQFVGKQPAFSNFGALGVRVASTIYQDMKMTSRYSDDESKQWTDTTWSNNRNMRECLRNYTETVKAGPYNIDGEQVYADVSSYAAFGLIPDMIGLKVVYDTYMDKLQREGPEQYPPGVGLTDIQSMFLAMAQDRCAKRRDESSYNRVESGGLTEELQVNVILGHFEGFSQAFQCPSGSKMNPKNKCKVW